MFFSPSAVDRKYLNGVLWQIVKNEMKCRMMRQKDEMDFIKVCTVY